MITYEEWAKDAEVVKKYTGGMRQSVDIWVMPDGTELAEHTRFAGFLSSLKVETIVQIPFPLNHSGDFDCEMVEGEDEGLWFPVFRGDDSLKLAYNFVKDYRETMED